MSREGQLRSSLYVLRLAHDLWVESSAAFRVRRESIAHDLIGRVEGVARVEPDKEADVLVRRAAASCTTHFVRTALAERTN